jgi:hypothetical protein
MWFTVNSADERAIYPAATPITPDLDIAKV